jgi:hypothetical protein
MTLTHRREILSYLLILSALALTLGIGAALIQYLTPDRPTVSIGSVSEYPPGAEPRWVAVGTWQFWVVNLDGEIVVFNPVSTLRSLPCRVKWTSNQRFESPCGGEKFEIDGTWAFGPAPRDMDRYGYTIDERGQIMVDVWDVILGAPHP